MRIESTDLTVGRIEAIDDGMMRIGGNPLFGPDRERVRATSFRERFVVEFEAPIGTVRIGQTVNVAITIAPFPAPKDNA